MNLFNSLRFPWISIWHVQLEPARISLGFSLHPSSRKMQWYIRQLASKILVSNRSSIQVKHFQIVV